MDNTHDGWAHVRDLAQDLAADTTLTKDIRRECTRIYDGINGGNITALNERDSQSINEAIAQSIRNTKSRSF